MIRIDCLNADVLDQRWLLVERRGTGVWLLPKSSFGPGETIGNELCGRTCIVMPPRRFNQDLRFSEVLEDLTVEQFIAQGAVE